MRLGQRDKLSLTSPKHLLERAVSLPLKEVSMQALWSSEGLARVIPHLLTKTSNHTSHLLIQLRIVFGVPPIMQILTQKMEYRASRDSVPKAMSKSTTL